MCNRADLARELTQLRVLDPRLDAVAELVPEVPLRLREPGFTGLAHIVIAQLVSVASARAISARLEALLPHIDAAGYSALDEAAIRGCGLSNAKYQALLGVAQAELAGEFDFAAIAELPVAQAEQSLCAFKGIGPWTAQVYLLFCAGHLDIFPAGDLALRKAAKVALDLTELPSIAQLKKHAATWSPHRGSAARLLWAYYAYLEAREGLI
ncbi:MAG: DNA-3-methyladenine glycosylase family protein [Pseudomonadales bacterium]